MSAPTGPRTATARFRGPVGFRVGFVFSADGRRLLTANGTSEVAQLWDTRTGALTKTLTGHNGSLQRIGFTPNGRTAITVGRTDDTVRLWRVPG